MSFNHSLKQQT